MVKNLQVRVCLKIHLSFFDANTQAEFYGSVFYVGASGQHTCAMSGAFGQQPSDIEDVSVSLHFLQYSCCSPAQSSLFEQDDDPAIGHLSTKYWRKHPPDAESHNRRDALQ
jgi:hypothetical protein